VNVDDTPTNPGRHRVTSNRKTGMQIASQIAVVLVVLIGWGAHVLTSEALIAAVAVLGLGETTSKGGNAIEHLAGMLGKRGGR
jgi:hypothetical protein